MIIKRVFPAILILLPTLAASQVTTETPESGDRVSVVVLDAGHGGHDPGAQGRVVNEKDIVLPITLKVGKYIEENFPDVKVIYTRSTDVFIPLYERADIANKNKADLFISIHANWVSSSGITGTETFVMGPSADARNREVAIKENSVITLEEDYSTHYKGFDPNSIESNIIFNLMQKTYLNQSLQFAGLVQNQLRERAKRVDRGVKQDVFIVLWRTTMPSVLIETGFISSRTEERYLMSEQGQDYLASAIFRAFRDYKTSIESRSASTMPAPREIRDEDIRPATLLTRSTDPVSPEDDAVYFMVQVLVTSKILPLDHEDFSDYGHVTEFKRNNLYIYAVEHSTSYSQVSAALQEIQDDFPGAFIIAVKGGTIIPVTEDLKKNK